MPAPSDSALPDPTTAALQRLLDGWVEDGNGIGVTAAVVAADGGWAGAAGVDGAERAVVPETAMAVGGVTKTFLAAEVLLLADAGRLDLGAPVTDYVDLPFDARGASVRQTLAMRSGFPIDPAPRLLPELSADPDRSWDPADVVARADPDGPRAGQLGGSWFANDLDYVVLGMVVEEVTGEPLAETLRRDLADPAGLRRTWFQDDEEPQGPLAVGGDDRAGVVDPGGPFLPSRAAASALGATAGAAADAPSLARWGYLLYGGRVVPTPLVERMTARTPGAEYGLGTEVLELGGEPFVGHRGAVPGFHAALLVSTARQTAVAVLVPATAGVRLGTGDDAADLALELHRAVATGRG